MLSQHRAGTVGDVRATSSLVSSYPGYDGLTSHLETLITSYPPQFIYIYDPETPRLAASATRAVLQSSFDQDTHLRLTYACIDAIACFTPRLFYDTVLNTLSHWTPVWEDGCENWSGSSADGQRWNENLDTFLHGLRAVHAQIQTEVDSSSPPNINAEGKGKGKSKAMAREFEGESKIYRLVLVIEQAERLKESMPELMVPLTRLAELARIDIVTIMISDVRWEDIRPPLGASPEPYYMDAPTVSKQATLEMLSSIFSSAAASPHMRNVDPDAYHPALQPLYSHFLETLYSICAPFTHDPQELAYIAAARWPGFVQPVLDEHIRRAHNRNADRTDEHFDGDVPESDDDEVGLSELRPPTEDTRIRLTRLFTLSFTAALETLLPRLTSATDWARANMPPSDLLSIPLSQVPRIATSSGRTGPSKGAEALPRLAKFLLVAAFLASTNPPKTDLRMFGRGPDERAKRRRRKGGGTRKPKAGTTGSGVKIPQRLLGPMTVPLDRLLAILGVLLEENDADIRPAAPQYTQPGEYTDMEISRVTIHAQVMELASMRLLLRVSPMDRLDTAPTFKCGISYETALRLAKEVGILLNDLMWEPV